MALSNSPKKDNILRQAFRKIHTTVGFSKGYNFILFFLTTGALLGFTLARIQYLNYNDVYLPDASPGEAYFQASGHYRTGLLLHLATILPAAFLVILQFVPVVRHRWILVHRISGYITIVLVVTSMVGALMIARRAFGGSLDTQAGVGVLVIAVVGGIGIAYASIKRGRVDLHREWMLRS